MALSDELHKVDTFAAGVSSKLAQHFAELVQEGKTGDGPPELLVNERSVDGYLASFHWDLAKFNPNMHIRDITRQISKRVTEVETEMKSKMQAYSKVKGQLQAIDRKATCVILHSGGGQAWTRKKMKKKEEEEEERKEKERKERKRTKGRTVTARTMQEEDEEAPEIGPALGCRFSCVSASVVFTSNVFLLFLLFFSFFLFLVQWQLVGAQFG